MFLLFIEVAEGNVLHLSVILFKEGYVYPSVHLGMGVYFSMHLISECGQRGCMDIGLVWTGGGVWTVEVYTPQKSMATEAGGTHPTGMHPCFKEIYRFLVINVVGLLKIITPSMNRQNSF